MNISTIYYIRGQSWRRGTKCDCKVNWLWVRSPLEEMKYLYKFIFSFLRSGRRRVKSTALSSATQHAMPPEFGRKWGTECLNTRFPAAVCGIQREADLIYFNNNIHLIIIITVGFWKKILKLSIIMQFNTFLLKFKADLKK